MNKGSLPPKQGLYDPANEHDNCGVGFIANIKNKKSHEIVRQGLQILVNLDHRGAVGADPLAGDGAGILTQIPHDLYKEETAKLGFELPEIGGYAVAMTFLPQDEEARQVCMDAMEQTARDEGQEVMGWRDVPVDNACLGESVKHAEPVIRQMFIKNCCADEATFERKLFIIRKVSHRTATGNVTKLGLFGAAQFYITNLSTRTIVHKGMVLSSNLQTFYKDLSDERFTSAIALVHQRFSTNTFPSWKLAQPFRFMCHNGEINTVRGNINWMTARRHNMKSDVLGDDLEKLYPLIGDGASDSATFDNALELMSASGYSLPHAMMMMIPEAWDNNPLMDAERRAFYEYHASMMEPWDGPAAVCFTDGRQIGATLDRNGLRPARYVVTDDDFVIMASEVGVIPTPESKIIKKWRLQPGKMFLIDMIEGRIIDDEEIKSGLTASQPYQEWLDATQIHVADLPNEVGPMAPDADALRDQKQAFGYNQEDIKHFLRPMALTGQDPIGSMGRDTPIAVLSSRPKMLYDYFSQNFAQVTNPPIDPIREELVMSLVTLIGPRPNLLDPSHAASRKRLEAHQPILTNVELEKVRRIENHVDNHFRTATLDMTYPADQGAGGMKDALDRLFAAAEKAVGDGYNIVILSDRNVDPNHIAIPALLATSGVHHHLIRTGLRTEVGLVVETGEARRVHDFCLLAGYGAEAINPYLALDTIATMSGLPDDVSVEEAQTRYVKAVDKGMLKVFSKMGISTYQSYCGGQIFDAVGLNDQFIADYFTNTHSAIGGVGLKEISSETAQRHRDAFGNDAILKKHLDVGGELAFRQRGEEHAWTPETIQLLQHAVRKGDRETYQKFEAAMNGHDKDALYLRGLFELKGTGKSIDINEVEPIEEICKRFATGAMSFGSISWEAHTTMALAMNRIGGKSNTGEGGEEAVRWAPMDNGDSMRSAIKQVASGRFGVTAEYLVNADDIQIKMAQGAKPGEGGQLPGHKVNEWIGRMRHSTPGVGLISPPPHHDIYSIEDLAQLIHDLKNVNPQARISVKLVSEVGVGTVAAGVSKAYADHVTISGFDGGTGASPLTSTMNAGSPWEIGLAETHQTLVLNKLRGRIAVQVDGGLRTARDVVVGALLGAEEFGFATGALIAAGCLMMRKCHLNTCPVGIATQNEDLRKLFTGQPAHVVNYFTFMAEEIRVIMAEMGFRTIEEMVGRSDALDMNKAINHYKAEGLDFSKILYKPDVSDDVAVFNCEPQNHGLEKALDNGFIEQAQPALADGTPVKIEAQFININRSIGAMLSGEVAKKYAKAGLPEDTIVINATGNAGQSLGAWLAQGISIDLKGDANDYVGKGMSGGRISIRPGDDSKITPQDNIIVGNTCMYGATAGEAYFNGVAGERFAVRNSGATTVVEGVGDHGCEYMTGGIVVCLGETGRNFAAGMSGGIAYVLDETKTFEAHCNMAQVELEPISAEDKQMEAEGQGGDLETHGRVGIEHDMTRHDAERLKGIIKKHLHYTGSPRAQQILDGWDAMLPKFVKVMPVEYRRALQEMQAKDRAAEHDGVTTSVGN